MTSLIIPSSLPSHILILFHCRREEEKRTIQDWVSFSILRAWERFSVDITDAMNTRFPFLFNEMWIQNWDLQIRDDVPRLSQTSHLWNVRTSEEEREKKGEQLYSEMPFEQKEKEERIDTSCRAQIFDLSRESINSHSHSTFPSLFHILSSNNKWLLD